MASHKKRAIKRGATRVFWEESGFSTRPSIRFTWWPRGQTPILRERYAHWEHLSALGAVTLSADRQRSRGLLSCSSGSVKSENVVAALRAMRRHLRGAVVLLWARLAAPRGRPFRLYLEKQRSWLQVEWFPAYAPELNPVEGLWSCLDTTALAHFSPDNSGEVAQPVRKGRRRLRRNPDLPKAFWKHAKLFPELLLY